jgi:hypothetical protein
MARFSPPRATATKQHGSSNCLASPPVRASSMYRAVRGATRTCWPRRVSTSMDWITRSSFWRSRANGARAQHFATLAETCASCPPAISREGLVDRDRRYSVRTGTQLRSSRWSANGTLDLAAWLETGISRASPSTLYRHATFGALCGGRLGGRGGLRRFRAQTSAAHFFRDASRST